MKFRDHTPNELSNRGRKEWMMSLLGNIKKIQEVIYNTKRDSAIQTQIKNSKNKKKGKGQR